MLALPKHLPRWDSGVCLRPQCQRPRGSHAALSEESLLVSSAPRAVRAGAEVPERRLPHEPSGGKVRSIHPERLFHLRPVERGQRRACRTPLQYSTIDLSGTLRRSLLGGAPRERQPHPPSARPCARFISRAPLWQTLAWRREHVSRIWRVGGERPPERRDPLW